jgi:hypothetical protein
VINLAQTHQGDEEKDDIS